MSTSFISTTMWSWLKMQKSKTMQQRVSYEVMLLIDVNSADMIVKYCQLCRRFTQSILQGHGGAITTKDRRVSFGKQVAERQERLRSLALTPLSALEAKSHVKKVQSLVLSAVWSHTSSFSGMEMRQTEERMHL